MLAINVALDALYDSPSFVCRGYINIAPLSLSSRQRVLKLVSYPCRAEPFEWLAAVLNVEDPNASYNNRLD